MRRTLLVVALAVLASTLFAPHQDHWSALDGVRWKGRHEAYYTERRADLFDDLVPNTITVAGHGIFNFPRGMTPDQIRDALRKKFPSDKEIVFRAANRDDLFSAADKRSPTAEEIRGMLEAKQRASRDDKRTDAAKSAFDPSKPFEVLSLPLMTVYHPAQDIYYQPDWVDEWKWYPAFWPAKSLLLTPFIAQTVFLATLAAVLVNLRQKKSR